jgi:peptidoglycan/LPS O-acetylase OafA/YrhL
MLLPKSLFFKGVEFLTGLGVSILFAWGFYLLVEKPCLKLSKQVNYNI